MGDVSASAVLPDLSSLYADMIVYSGACAPVHILKKERAFLQDLPHDLFWAAPSVSDMWASATP